MRLMPIVFVLMLLAQFCFSANYSSAYVIGDWLKVTRTVSVSETPGCASGAATGACSSTGAIQPSLDGSGAGVSTTVVLLVENIGPATRQNVEISESMSFVPSGAKLHFNVIPSIFDGNTAIWKISSMEKGEARNISYAFPASLSAGQAGRIIAATAKATPPKISITAPASSFAGQKIPISARTADGAPAANIVILIGCPDGTIRSAKADSSGAASFTAEKEGFYTYSADGYSLSRLVSTEVQEAPAIPSNAASAVGQDSLSSFVFSLLPALAAIFAAAVLVLLAYNFLTAKKEDEPYYSPPDSAKQQPYSQAPQQPLPASQQAQQARQQPAQAPYGQPPQPASQSSQRASQAPISQYVQPSVHENASYTQKFTFSQEQQAQQPSAEITRSLVESRKKQLRVSEVAEKEPQHNHVSYSEKTIDAEQQAASLATDATESGELTQHEEEIAKTMRELEDIRLKLQERRSFMQKYAEQSGAAKGEPEERRPSPRKPSPKMAKKAKPKASAKKRR